MSEHAFYKNWFIFNTQLSFVVEFSLAFMDCRPWIIAPLRIYSFRTFLYSYSKDEMSPDPDSYAHLAAEFNMQSCRTTFTSTTILARAGSYLYWMEQYVLWCETATPGDQDEGRASVLNWMTRYWLGNGAGSWTWDTITSSCHCVLLVYSLKSC